MKTRKGMGKGMGKGYKNLINVYDAHVHGLSAKGVKTWQSIKNNEGGWNRWNNLKDKTKFVEMYPYNKSYIVQNEKGFNADGLITVVSSKVKALKRVKEYLKEHELDAKGLHIEPTYVPRGKGNNPNAGARDLHYKIREWGYIFPTKESAEKYADEHTSINGIIIENKKLNAEGVDADKLRSGLSGFTGTEQYHKVSITPVVVTDGVQYLCDKAGAYWLVDAIGSYQGEPKLKREPFQVWILKKDKDGKGATLSAYNDYSEKEPNKYKPLVTQKIEYTDFPLDEIKLYVEGNVVLLPSEH